MEKKENLKKIESWSLWLKGEILITISFLVFLKISCKESNKNVNHSLGRIEKIQIFYSSWALSYNCVKTNVTFNS
jgi:hypothetical protein